MLISFFLPMPIIYIFGALACLYMLAFSVNIVCTVILWWMRRG
jgi:hypothetical protein